MPISRSLFAGDTSYIGATLDDILTHLVDWKEGTEDTIRFLEDSKKEVDRNRELIRYPDEVIEFIDYTLDQLGRFKSDFERLLVELPRGVDERHPELVLRLAQFSKIIDDSCLDFKREHIQKGMRSESQRPLLDAIYSRSRTQAFDYLDLFNLGDQLKTFVGTRTESSFGIEDVDVLEHKPNFFGFGVNLNHIIKRWKKWFRQR